MLLMILLTGHMIADFVFQSSKMAENKQKNTMILLEHGGLYLLVFAVINFVFMQPKTAICTTFIVAGTHLIVDFIRTKFDNSFKNSRFHFYTFLID